MSAIIYHRQLVVVAVVEQALRAYPVLLVVQVVAVAVQLWLHLVGLAHQGKVTVAGLTKPFPHSALAAVAVKVLLAVVAQQIATAVQGLQAA
jgi:hypothetical protein